MKLSFLQTQSKIKKDGGSVNKESRTELNPRQGKPSSIDVITEGMKESRTSAAFQRFNILFLCRN